MICSTLRPVTVDVYNSLYNSKNEIQVAACIIAILIAAPPISVAYSFIPVPQTLANRRFPLSNNHTRFVAKPTAINLTAYHTTVSPGSYSCFNCALLAMCHQSRLYYIRAYIVSQLFKIYKFINIYNHKPMLLCIYNVQYTQY